MQAPPVENPTGVRDPSAPRGPSGHGPDYDLREEHAYREGLRAYLAGFPWVYMATLRYLWTNVPLDRLHVPYAALNRFWHMRHFADASLGDGARPNNDTPYSTAWLDLTSEPLILSHRDMGQRYFAFDLVGMGLDRFASIGSRLTGPAAGAFAIRGPDWQGPLPRGVVPLPRATSNSVLLLGRTEAHGIPDLRAAREAQSGYRLVPLNRWPDSPLPPESRAVLAPIPPAGDPLGDWKTMNQAMTVDPPRRTGAAVEGWAHLGIGAGLQVETQPEATRHGLARAAAHARRALSERAQLDPRSAVDGWSMLLLPSDATMHVSDFSRWQIPAAGTFGRADLELVASLVCDPAHAPVEFVTSVDADGAPLVGGRSYTLRFPPGGLPPARYFWSATAYGLDGSLVPECFVGQSMGNRVLGFVRDPDGGATIAIQSTEPSACESWLPSPTDRRSFSVVLRLYAGDRAAIAATWRPPAIVLKGHA